MGKCTLNCWTRSCRRNGHARHSFNVSKDNDGQWHRNKDRRIEETGALTARQRVFKDAVLSQAFTTAPLFPPSTMSSAAKDGNNFGFFTSFKGHLSMMEWKKRLASPWRNMARNPHPIMLLVSTNCFPSAVLLFAGDYLFLPYLSRIMLLKVGLISFISERWRL